MLLGLIYCEFDNLLGPVIVHAHPENVLAQEVFEPVSDYIIARPEICGKFTTVIVPGMQVMGYPLCIANDKYHRNALLFNLCFLLDSTCDVRPYQPVLRKIANLLRTMELECEFLYNRVTKERLRDVLRLTFEQLTSTQRVALRITEDHALCASLVDPRDPLPEVNDWDVPVRIRDLDALVSGDWELGIQQIVPHIDGVNFVSRIAQKVCMHPSIARTCVAHLVRAKCVQLVDVFQYSNVYATAAGLLQLGTDHSLQRECVWYVTRTGCQPPPMRRVFELFAWLRGGRTVHALCEHARRLRLDFAERRFVLFGLMHGIIRRVHAYPLQLGTHSTAASAPRLEGGGVRLDGSMHFDALCCTQGRSFAELNELVLGDAGCVIVSK